MASAFRHTATVARTGLVGRVERIIDRVSGMAVPSRVSVFHCGIVSVPVRMLFNRLAACGIAALLGISTVAGEPSLGAAPEEGSGIAVEEAQAAAV